MAKIDKNEFGKRRPKLLVEDLDGNDAVALTVVSVERITQDDNGTKRQSLVLTFEETGDKVYYPNVSSIGYLVDVLGDDDDDWIGKPIPLMRHAGEFKGKPYENVQVAEPSMWGEILTAAGFPAPKAARTVVPRLRAPATPATPVKRKARGR